MNTNEGERIETKSEEPIKTEDEAGESDAKKRERSTVDFPYSDLDTAIEIARKIHDKAGFECTVPQLAAWLSYRLTSGTFRSRYSAARIFGLIETERGGNVRLTTLGREVLDPQKTDRAKAQAFLDVELFHRIYESYEGHALPPTAALQSQMAKFGVAPKQADRARQTFIKSAKSAKFIDRNTGVFIKPAFRPINEPDPAEPTATTNDLSEKHAGGGGNGGDIPPTLDPIIRGLIDRLPETGSVWSSEKRKLWLKILEDTLQLVYSYDGTPSKDEISS